MLDIYVKGRRIDLPEDISFEYTAENRLFTNADGYSFDFEVPVRDSSVNSEIFGWIWRMDADVESVRYRASIITEQLSLDGVVAVVGVSDRGVSLQFLEGRSAQNSEKVFEETFVNELTLGYTKYNIHTAHLDPGTAMDPIDKGADSVALPWVISSSGEIIHNAVEISGGELKWGADAGKLVSFMPFLLTVAKRICEALGYSYDFSRWEQSDFRHLVICNAIPASLKLQDFSWNLPHWSVNEFFENLEIPLRGEFDVDHLKKNISFRFSEEALDSFDNVHIDDVIDVFEADIEIDEDANPDAEILKNVGYPDCDNRFWPMLSCDWYIRRRNNEANAVSEETRAPGSDRVDPGLGWTVETMPEIDYDRFVVFETMQDMVDRLWTCRYSTNGPGSLGNALFYVREVNSYFAFYCVKVAQVRPVFIGGEDGFSPVGWKECGLEPLSWFYHNVLRPVNVFGDYIVKDDDDADRIELAVAPAIHDLTDDDFEALFLPFSGDDNAEPEDWSAPDPKDVDSFRQPTPAREMMDGKKSRTEYYDKLYLGFWDGLKPYHFTHGFIPRTSNYFIWPDWQYDILKGETLRLNNGFDRGCPQYRGMDPFKLYKFSFLTDSLPSPRAIFYIRGKKYACAKLTASFSSSGMSKLVKGEFYRIP